MLVTCRPGIGRQNLRDTLRSLLGELSNVGGHTRNGAHDRLLAYLEWARQAEWALSSQVSSADLDRLVLTRRYELLLSALGGLAATAVPGVIEGLVRIEVDQRIKAFEDALDALDRQIKSWSRPGVFVVADTSVYVQHPQKLEDLDFASVLPVRDEPVHVVVPIAVVDELDGLKQSKDARTRWRAGYTLAVLDRVFNRTTEPAQLREEDFSALCSGSIPREEVTIEIVFDPPGHVRLPINDDEIIDRTLTIEPLAAREITLLTYDTGQSTRARAAGLHAVKLTSPIGNEPK